MKEEKQPVEITDSNASAFKEFLQFFYLNEVTLTMENIEEVMKLADKYDMSTHLDICVMFLGKHMNEGNVIWMYTLSISSNNQRLKEFCEKFISIYVIPIFNSKSFQSCDHEILKNILKIDTLKCTEIEVLYACLAWAKFGKKLTGEEIRAELNDCLYLIRFPTMKPGVFCQATMTYKGLLTEDELVDVFYTILHPDLRSSVFIDEKRSFPPVTFANALSCEHVVIDNQLVYANTQPFRFSVSAPAFFGKIYLPRIFMDQGFHVKCNLEFHELEYSTSGEKHSTHLGTSQILLSRTFIEMSPPRMYLLKPGNKYEIRFEFHTEHGPTSGRFQIRKAYWNRINKLNDESTLTLDEDTPTVGRLVSELIIIPV